jgi:hypothetical protein
MATPWTIDRDHTAVLIMDYQNDRERPTDLAWACDPASEQERYMDFGLFYYPGGTTAAE